MKNLSTITLTLVTLAVILFTQPVTVNAQTDENTVTHGVNFVDENGDGYNDNAPDADGDGIPNGQDPDYTGSKSGKRHMAFVDEDGDGYNDNAPDADGDGIPNGLDEDWTGQKMRSGRTNHGAASQLRDADGDGIPNGQDEDYVCTGDGTGSQSGRAYRGGRK